MTSIELRTYGPMNYYALRPIIEDKIASTGLAKGLVTIHAKGATPSIVVIDRDLLEDFDRVLRNIIPVIGWRHGNAYAHLRSTVMGTAYTLPFKDAKLLLPRNYEVYFVETRPVYNHRRIVHLYIRG